LRYEARRIFRVAIAQLRSRTAPVNEIAPPIRKRLSDLNQTEGAIEKAIA
jgi:hypothetical protein